MEEPRVEGPSVELISESLCGGFPALTNDLVCTSGTKVKS